MISPPNRRRPRRARPRAARLALAAASALALGGGLGAVPAGAVPFTASTVPLTGTVAGTESGLGLGDFDGDGRTDAAVGTFNGYLSILLGDGAGGFTHAPGSPLRPGNAYLGPLEVADLNGDGHDDVIALRENGLAGYGAVVLLGDGDGTFAPEIDVPLPGSAVTFALGRLDGGGRHDLVVLSDTLEGPQLFVLLGDGDGTFGPAIPSPGTLDGTYPSRVALGDFDRDGTLDAAVAHVFTRPGIVSILRGDGAGGFARLPGSPYDIGSGTLALSAGDLDGDGTLDLAAPVIPASRDNRTGTTGA